MISRYGAKVTVVKVSLPKRNNYPKLFRWAFAKYVNDCHLREALSFELFTVRFAHRIFI